MVYNKFKAENVGIARFLKYLKHKVYTPRPIIQLFTAVKHGNFQMKMYDIVVCVFFFVFFFWLKHRSRVHIAEQSGLCRTWSESRRKFFLAVVAGNVTT